jgi:hypothetical protein
MTVAGAQTNHMNNKFIISGFLQHWADKECCSVQCRQKVFSCPAISAVHIDHILIVILLYMQLKINLFSNFHCAAGRMDCIFKGKLLLHLL